MHKQMEHPDILEVRDLRTWFPVKRGVFSKTIGYVRAVDGVTFSVRKGEILGLVGESGCGKTTLGRTLVGLESPQSGDILFAGKDIFKFAADRSGEFRKKMQIIFQDPLSSLNPRMNVMDIVTEGLAEFKMLDKSRKEHAVKIVKDVGMDEDCLFRYPHEFSGGQRQRINIARAISLHPDFIVCDEPVSALDVSVQAQVINLLMDLRDRFNLSYLFISHDLSVVHHIANRTAVMYLGKFAEYGPTGELISNPLHPYSKALISSVPTPGVHTENRIVLQGEIPSPSSPPPGCRFHTRCPYAMATCRSTEPEGVEINGHRVWCHLYR